MTKPKARRPGPQDCEPAMFKRILVCLDGSEPAERALHAAIDQARIHGAELMAIHVVPLPEAASVEDSPKRAKERGEEQAQFILGAAGKLARSGGLALRAVVRYGHAADQILHAAEEERVDLIVIGSRGRSGIKRFIIGGVSSAVSRHAGASVLIVK